MAELKIKNVGPIKGGLPSDKLLKFDGVTVLTGNQGSGKSTVAKIFSTLSWIEKALLRGDFSGSYLSQYNRFKKQLAYQNISNYLNDDSIIEYYGKAFTILFQNNKLEVIENENKEDFKFPKIMYVPAERNFVSSVDRPDLVKRLPLPLYTFLDEFEEAKQNIGDGINLPIGGIRFEYRKQNKKSQLIGPDFKIDLLEASSGFQSLVPLFLVTRHLTKIIKHSDNLSHREISVNEEKEIRSEIERIFGNLKISEDVRRILLERLSSRFKYGCFINIVEEPEQNLYPISQKEVLFELLNSKNEDEGNKLILTTHSPYIINYLTLSIKAGIIKEKITTQENQNNLNKELSKIVPLNSTVLPSEVNIYQLGLDGSIEKLKDYKGLPSDENILNEFLLESNELFTKLLEIELKCQ